MSTPGLIFKEMGHRRWSTLLALLAVVTAVGFSVAFFTTGEASQRETRRNMRDIGQNLRIISKATDMGAFWDNDYSSVMMPEEWIKRFEKVTGLFYSHLSATLKQRIEWDGDPALISGMAAEVAPPDRKKPSMTFNIKPGEIFLGYQLVKKRGLKKQNKVTIRGKEFVIAGTLAEAGTDDDIRIYMHLKDAQEILGVTGKINEIQALDCYCRNPDLDTLTVLREQLAEVLPEAQVIKMQAIALAREKQRTMMDDYFNLIMPLVVVACGLLIGVLAMLNTRDRREEIGILRALGFGTPQIATLFLGKAVLLGLIGAGLGFAIGTGWALHYGPDIFKLTVKKLQPMYPLLYWSFLLAPLFAAVSSFIPAMLAVAQDPAETLRPD
ncbi:MAG: ABC-type lipoprotein release transport system permease subunit [Limisphaerales bacterium]|jgi:ABC-type lipoprotein release transport system permease subunit